MRPPMRDHRQSYRSGPIGLFARYRRWHLTAPTWQIALLTLMQLVLIVLVWGSMLAHR